MSVDQDRFVGDGMHLVGFYHAIFHCVIVYRGYGVYPSSDADPLACQKIQKDCVSLSSATVGPDIHSGVVFDAS
jgi:hypothetical protein